MSGERRQRDVAEAPRRVVYGPSEPSSEGRQVGGQRGHPGLAVVAGVVGELHRDGVRRALWHGPVQLLDGPVRLYALVEPDEAHAFAKPGDVVAEDARGDDGAELAEHVLQVLLSHALGQPRHVQVGALDGLARRPRVRHLDGLVLQAEAVELADGALGVVGAQVVDEAVAQRLACGHRAEQSAAVGTCYFIADEFAGL